MEPLSLKREGWSPWTGVGDFAIPIGITLATCAATLCIQPLRQYAVVSTLLVGLSSFEGQLILNLITERDSDLPLLRTWCQAHRLELKSAPRDGSCGYHSVLRALGKTDMRKLRSDVVDHLEKNPPEWFEGDLEAHLEGVRHNTWMFVEIDGKAAGDLLGAEVWVMRLRSSDPILVNIDRVTDAKPGAPQAVLVSDGGHHFDYLLLPDVVRVGDLAEVASAGVAELEKPHTAALNEWLSPLGLNVTTRLTDEQSGFWAIGQVLGVGLETKGRPNLTDGALAEIAEAHKVEVWVTEQAGSMRKLAGSSERQILLTRYKGDLYNYVDLGAMKITAEGLFSQ